MVRLFLILVGSLSLALGVLGIFIPLLPTTPFLLLSAACYARSSNTFYFWLTNNKYFGTYIRNYREGKGIKRSVKICAISFLWISILFSVIFATDKLALRIILPSIAAIVTWHIATIKTMGAK